MTNGFLTMNMGRPAGFHKEPRVQLPYASRPSWLRPDENYEDYDGGTSFDHLREAFIDCVFDAVNAPVPAINRTLVRAFGERDVWHEESQQQIHLPYWE